MQQVAFDIFPKPNIELWQGDCFDLPPPPKGIKCQTNNSQTGHLTIYLRNTRITGK